MTPRSYLDRAALIEARFEAGLTQADVAALAGISPQYLSSLELGKRAGVNARTVKRLAVALDVPVGRLLRLPDLIDLAVDAPQAQ